MSETITEEKIYTKEEFLTQGDFLYATAYAWGRSDHGAHLDSNDIYKFGVKWSHKKRDFRAGKLAGLPSMQSFYDDFFSGK